MTYTVRMKKPAKKKTAAAGGRVGAAALAAEETRTARLHAGLTQTQLAARVGTSQKGIVRLESGAHNATIGTLERVAKATGSVLDLRIRPKKPA